MYVYRWERSDGRSMFSDYKPEATDVERYCFITIKSAMAYISRRDVVEYDNHGDVDDMVLCRYEADESTLVAELGRPGEETIHVLSPCNSIADFANQFVVNVEPQTREVLSYLTYDQWVELTKAYKKCKSRLALAKFFGVTKDELDVDLVCIWDETKRIPRVPYTAK